MTILLCVFAFIMFAYSCWLFIFADDLYTDISQEDQ